MSNDSYTIYNGLKFPKTPTDLPNNGNFLDWVQSSLWIEDLLLEKPPSGIEILYSAIPFERSITSSWEYEYARKVCDEGYTNFQTGENQAIIFQAIRDFLEWGKPYSYRKKKPIIKQYLIDLENFLKQQSGYLQGVEHCTGYIHFFGEKELIKEMISKKLLYSREELLKSCDALLVKIAKENLF